MIKPYKTNVPYPWVPMLETCPDGQECPQSPGFCFVGRAADCDQGMGRDAEEWRPRRVSLLGPCDFRMTRIGRQQLGK